ncbi:alpha/beta hydrolase [Arthrobacter sp. ISL-69]|uniref:alpha/beta hydrolase n=1 Tax=Arthrobacter sp. ISL-69 TaxID=2819113 RepID=UPI001BEB3BB6|nr:CocE/NonD family hydrolase [Arthrobacter sp. ISL-69]MBT2539024.1 alpha/beta fold hydrolase [Arthrobacter sp. ISL-69]
MTIRSNVEFEGEDGVILRGWLYRPEGSGLKPAITMAHGFAAVKEHGLDSFARAFAAEGFIVLVHDHRNFGTSEGTPRHDIDPWRQIADWRRAITFLEMQPGVAPDRIGIWGTSFAGGHAIVLGATDRRLSCVVAQVPTISGYDQGQRRVSPDATASLEAAFAEDERQPFRGGAPRRTRVVSSDLDEPAAYRSPDAIDFYTQVSARETWVNDVTLRSTRAARSYEPGPWAPRVSPTPLLLVVALRDTVTVTDLALRAYENALEPKRLVTIRGGHFSPYETEFQAASSAALAWFTNNL